MGKHVLVIGFALVAPTVSAAGFDIFLTQPSLTRVARYDGVTGAYHSLRQFGGERITDLVCGPDGMLYLTDVFMAGTFGFRPTDWANTGFFTSGSFYAMYEIAFTPDRQYLYSTSDLGIVERFNGITGQYLNQVSYNGGSNRGFEVGPDSAIYVSRARIDVATGQSANYFEVPPYQQVGGAKFDSRGNYYMACEGGRILKWDWASGALLGIFAETGGLDLWDFTFGPDGDMYVVSKVSQSSFDGQVLKFDGITGQLLGVAVPHQENISLFAKIAIATVPEPATIAVMTLALTLFLRRPRCSGNR